MSLRMDKRRGNIVSLSQTEIMLVLAMIILVLLAAKSIDLEETDADLEETNAELVKVCNESTDDSCLGILGYQVVAEATTGQSQEIDPDEPITEDLVAGGAAKKTETQLGPAGDSDDSGSMDSKQEPEDSVDLTNPESVRATIAALEEAKQEAKAEAEQQREENKHLEEENKDLQKANDEQQEQINNSRESAEGESAADVVDKSLLENEQLKKENKQLKTKLELRRRIGFVPCWERGKRGYYFAINIIYNPKDQKFLLKSHSHITTSAKVVRRALSGALSLLESPPEGWISREKFLEYASDVETARKQLYPDNPKCRLVATINEEDVLLEVSNKIIRDRSRFYPIARRLPDDEKS